jgi:hypothetical protein
MSAASQKADAGVRKARSLESSDATRVIGAVGVLTTLLIANQFLLRFLLGTDLLGFMRPEARAAHDAQVFAAWAPLFIAFVVASGVASLSAASAVAAIARQPVRLETVPGVVRIFVWACVAAALLGCGVAFALGPESLGGTDRIFYYAGLAVTWLVFVGMALLALNYRDTGQVFDWLLYNVAAANITLLVIPQIAFWPLFGFTPQEAYSTAVTIAPVGALLASFAYVLSCRNQL